MVKEILELWKKKSVTEEPRGYFPWSPGVLPFAIFHFIPEPKFPQIQFSSVSISASTPSKIPEFQFRTLF